MMCRQCGQSADDFPSWYCSTCDEFLDAEDVFVYCDFCKDCVAANRTDEFWHDEALVGRYCDSCHPEKGGGAP